MHTPRIYIQKHEDTLKCIILAVLALLLLVAGGLVYVAFRSLSLRMFGWIDALGLSGPVNDLRIMFGNLEPGHFMLYNLPDLLWISSYLLFVNAIIPRNDRRRYIFWVLLMPLLAVFHEAMQGLGLMTGSFDTIDLLCYIVPTVINLITINISKPNVKLTELSYEKTL